jgi:hypothetical protein
MWLWLLLGLLGALGLFLFIRNRNKANQLTQETINDEELPEEPELDPDAMIKFNQMCQQRIVDRYGEPDQLKANLLTAQAAFETGDFSSELLQENQNAFGMRQAKIRETSSIGDKGGYASYPDVAASINDRLMWDDYNHVGNYSEYDVTKFCQAIYKLGYFTAPFLQYKNGVNAYYKKLLSELSKG